MIRKDKFMDHYHKHCYQKKNCTFTIYDFIQKSDSDEGVLKLCHNKANDFFVQYNCQQS